MKNFSIKFPNKREDSTGVYKNYLLNRLATAYSDLTIDGIDTEEDPFTSYQYIGPSGYVNVGAGFCSRCDISRGYGNNLFERLTYAPRVYNAAREFDIALKRLSEYASRQRNYTPLYDFLLSNGTPVREYKDFIQVGYDLIPKNNAYSYVNRMNARSQTNIINLTVVINNIVNNTEISI